MLVPQLPCKALRIRLKFHVIDAAFRTRLKHAFVVKNRLEPHP